MCSQYKNVVDSRSRGSREIRPGSEFNDRSELSSEKKTKKNWGNLRSCSAMSQKKKKYKKYKIKKNRTLARSTRATGIYTIKIKYSTSES